MESVDTRPIPARRTARRRLGCLAACLVALACLAGLLVAVVAVLNQGGGSPANPPQLTPSQLGEMAPLNGTWKDNGRSEIIFSDPSGTGSLYGANAGTVTFVDVPPLYSARWGPMPPLSGQGQWAVAVPVPGTWAEYIGGAEDSNFPHDGGIVFWFGGGTPFSGMNPSVMFQVEGSVSDPVLVCQYPDQAQACTYSRQS
jgi:hypothetical protein